VSEETTGRRVRYMEAMVDLASERHYDEVGVDQIAARAGGSAEEFESIFPSKQACAIAALEEVAESNLRTVRAAFEREAAWPDSLRAAAYAHVRWILDNPKKMRFGLLETLTAGELTNAMRDHLYGAYVAMIDAGREVAEDPSSVPPYAAEGVVGSIAQVVTRSLSKPGERDLFSLVPEMMYLAVRPYLGEAAARRELTMPVRR
jgi:AcrR family transcriptional regulator